MYIPHLLQLPSECYYFQISPKLLRITDAQNYHQDKHQTSYFRLKIVNQNQLCDQMQKGFELTHEKDEIVFSTVGLRFNTASLKEKKKRDFKMVLMKNDGIGGEEEVGVQVLRINSWISKFRRDKTKIFHEIVKIKANYELNFTLFLEKSTSELSNLTGQDEDGSKKKKIYEIQKFSSLTKTKSEIYSINQKISKRSSEEKMHSAKNKIVRKKKQRKLLTRNNRQESSGKSRDRDKLSKSSRSQIKVFEFHEQYPIKTQRQYRFYQKNQMNDEAVQKYEKSGKEEKTKTNVDEVQQKPKKNEKNQRQEEQKIAENLNLNKYQKMKRENLNDFKINLQNIEGKYFKPRYRKDSLLSEKFKQYSSQTNLQAQLTLKKFESQSIGEIHFLKDEKQRQNFSDKVNDPYFQYDKASPFKIKLKKIFKSEQSSMQNKKEKKVPQKIQKKEENEQNKKEAQKNKFQKLIMRVLFLISLVLVYYSMIPLKKI